jgi:ribosome maturation factor RimP
MQWVFAPTFYFGQKTMSKQLIEQRIQEVAEQAAEKNGLELIHAEIIGAVKDRKIRIFIDKPDGVTHEDCVAVSREIDEVLEKEDFFPTAYVLEVSSPGLERGLYKIEDFEKFAGNLAKIKTYQAINGQKNYRGRIIGIENEEVLFDDVTNGKVNVPFNAIAKANLEIDIEEELKRGKVKD